MKALDWLAGKTIVNTQVERAGMHLELWFQIMAQSQCLVATLELPGEMDWFETDGMTLEDTHGKQVIHVEHLEDQDNNHNTHHTYRLHFADMTAIDIFADVLANGGTYRIRESLSFRLQDPNEEPWDMEEDQSILDELEQDAEKRRQERETREAGQLDVRIFAQYCTRF